MTTLQAIILGIVQGLSEFLPISSSAHLILFSEFTNWSDQGVHFDLALHVGTLLAVMIYFSEELRQIIRDVVDSYRANQWVRQGSMLPAIVIATLPACFLGVLLFDQIDSTLRSVQVIFVTTVVFACLLAYADKKNQAMAGVDSISWRQSLMIGCAQAVALVPGVSRSGVTITAGLLMGLDRNFASKFSFLMAIPITTIAALAKLEQVIRAESITIDWQLFVLGTCVSFITALAAIHYFLKWLNQFGMMPYVIYRFALAVILISYL